MVRRGGRAAPSRQIYFPSNELGSLVHPGPPPFFLQGPGLSGRGGGARQGRYGICGGGDRARIASIEAGFNKGYPGPPPANPVPALFGPLAAPLFFLWLPRTPSPSRPASLHESGSIVALPRPRPSAGGGRPRPSLSQVASPGPTPPEGLLAPTPPAEGGGH